MTRSPCGRNGGVSFRVRASVPPPIRRMRLGRALLEAVCIVAGFTGFAVVVVFAL